MRIRVRSSKQFLSGGIVLLAACSASQGEDSGESALSLTVDSSATYTIVGIESEKCVQIEGASTANHGRAEIGACANTSSQRFRLQPVSGAPGFFSIRNVNSNRCLDVAGVSKADGASIIQWQCSSGKNQHFSLSAT